MIQVFCFFDSRKLKFPVIISKDPCIQVFSIRVPKDPSIRVPVDLRINQYKNDMSELYCNLSWGSENWAITTLLGTIYYSSDKWFLLNATLRQSN